VHDIGKIGLDRTLLEKASSLNAWERAEIERHPRIGHQILEPIPGFSSVLAITLHHHERWDGDGYPERLRGSEIEFLARVMALVDVFDALTSDRPYRSAFSVEEAKQIVRGGIGTQFDPELVPKFLAFLELLGSTAHPDEALFLQSASAAPVGERTASR
jgi:HD-GYP domain-containing protein (c-di-GMP phosphodiesterase class II)